MDGWIIRHISGATQYMRTVCHHDLVLLCSYSQISQFILDEPKKLNLHRVASCMLYSMLPTFGSRSRMTPLACEVRLIMECAYFSASSSDIEGNLRSTWPCLLQITYPSTPPCTLIRSIVSSTSLCGYIDRHQSAVQRPFLLLFIMPYLP